MIGETEARMSGYDLAYVALAVRDMDAARRVFAEGLGLAARPSGAEAEVYPLGRAALAVLPTGHPLLARPDRPGVDHVGLAAAAPEAAAARHGLPVVSAGPGLQGRAEAAVDPAATCGVALRFVEPAALGGTPTGAAVRRIDHIGIASADNEKVRAVFVAGFGCPLESTQTDLEIRTNAETFVSDKYPAVHIARPPQILGGLKTVFVTTGDCELEFLQDYDPNLKPGDGGAHGPGNTKGDQSAIARYVAKNGPGLHHLALKTPAIDPLLRRLDGLGCRMIDTAGRPGGRASRIGFVHPATFGGGLVLHFVERTGH